MVRLSLMYKKTLEKSVFLPLVKYILSKNLVNPSKYLIKMTAMGT
jgi:hypothetical protein